MKFAMLGLLLSMSASLPFVAEADSSLLSFQVYSKTDISSVRSDYQGTTGAGRDIYLSDFQILGDLKAGNRVQFIQGEVRGTIFSNERVLQRVSYRGSQRVSGLSAQLSKASLEMDRLALKLDRLSATSSAVRATVQVGSKTISGLKVLSQQRVEVVDLRAEELTTAGNLILEGRPGGETRLLVRIHGSVVNLNHVGFFITSGLRPEQIVYYFPDARDLQISYAGGATDFATGASWGIPGSVVAPCAELVFSEALIVGQVFVDRLLGFQGLAGGQVNASRSLLLREIAGDSCGCR